MCKKFSRNFFQPKPNTALRLFLLKRERIRWHHWYYILNRIIYHVNEKVGRKETRKRGTRGDAKAGALEKSSCDSLRGGWCPVWSKLLSAGIVAEPAFQHPASEYNPGRQRSVMRCKCNGVASQPTQLQCTSVPCSALLLLLLPSRAPLRTGQQAGMRLCEWDPCECW